MSRREEFSSAAAHHVRDTCLCIRVQRAARALARHFDDALRPLGLTHGQFSLLVSLSQGAPPIMGDVASVLAMDRTTLTTNLKPLARRGLVKVAIDRADRRSRRLVITAAGRARLAAAFPAWREAHAAFDRRLGPARGARLREDLHAIVDSLPTEAEAAAD